MMRMLGGACINPPIKIRIKWPTGPGQSQQLKTMLIIEDHSALQPHSLALTLAGRFRWLLRIPRRESVWVQLFAPSGRMAHPSGVLVDAVSSRPVASGWQQQSPPLV